jgi:hypothetical protein
MGKAYPTVTDKIITLLHSIGRTDGVLTFLVSMKFLSLYDVVTLQDFSSPD